MATTIAVMNKGMIEQMAKPMDIYHRPGLLTGNSVGRSRMKLTGAGLDQALIDWDAGSRTRVRSDLSLAARAQFETVPLVVIGDTPLDGHGAAKAGIPFIAVCTGVYDASAFKDEDCMLVLKDLENAEQIIAVFSRQAT